MLAGIILSFRWPGVGLAFILLMFGIEQFFQSQEAKFVSQSYLVNVGIGLVGATAASKVFLSNPERFNLSSVHLSVLLLFGLAWASILWTSEPNAAYSTYRAALPYQLLFFLFAPFLMHGKGDLKACFITILAIGIPLIVWFAIFSEWHGRGLRLASPVWYQGKLTYESPPLALANFAAIVGLTSIFLMPRNVLLRFGSSLFFCFACYVVYRTQSRGQLLALVGTMAVCFPLANGATTSSGIFKTVAASSVLVALLYLVFVSLDLGDLNRWGDKDVRRAVNGRWYMATTSLEAWAEGSSFELLFGMGTLASLTLYGTFVHNLPVEVLAELGIAGFGIYLFINVKTGLTLKELASRLSSLRELRRDIVLLAAMFIFSSIASLKEQTFSASESLFLLAILVASVEHATRRKTASTRSTYDAAGTNAHRTTNRVGS